MCQESKGLWELKDVLSNQSAAFTFSDETVLCLHSGWTSRTLITVLNRTLTQVQTRVLINLLTLTLVLVFTLQDLVLSWWSLIVP